MSCILAEVVNLAYDAQIYGVLPAAFYEVHRQTTARNLIGQSLPFSLSPEFIFGEPNNSFSFRFPNALKSPYVRQLMEGQEWLHMATSHLIFVVLPTKTNEGSRLCLNKQAKCTQAISDWWHGVHQSSANYSTRDPLIRLSSLKASVGAVGLCRPCSLRTQRAIEISRTYLWDELPYFFGLKAREQGVTYGYKKYM